MSFNTPVLFLIFNRLDTTKQVFNEIRKAKPKKLYIAADGPRNVAEKVKTDLVRKKVLEKIDWDCKVKILFRKKNLGCGKAVSEAISWFFKNEKMGIILEDDCLPDSSFFYFCENLLKKYEHNSKIMHISGTNFQYNGGIKVDESYFFSKYTHIWGWATWRRAWKTHDLYLKKWSQIRKNSEKFDRIFDNFEEITFFHRWFDLISKNPFTTWDVQWQFACFLNKGLAVQPNENLVKNVGFSADSTHTNNGRLFIQKAPLKSIWNIVHPSKIVQKKNADAFDFKRWGGTDILFRLSDYIRNAIKI